MYDVCVHACACWNCTHFLLYCWKRMKALIFTHCSMNIEWVWFVFSDPAKKKSHSHSFFLCVCLCSHRLACVYFHFYFSFVSLFSLSSFFVIFKMKKCETCTWLETISCLPISVEMISEQAFHAGTQHRCILLCLTLLVNEF